MNGRLLGIVEPGRALVQDRAGVSVQILDENGVSAELRDLFVSRVFDERVGLVGNGSAAGEGVFDFRYGPFTGGYSEAGIFHLHTYGEKILAVEVDLSCKHRAIETSMAGKSLEECLGASEAVAGNFAFAHSLAFCRAVESALALEVPRQARRLRIIGLELERIYNHLLVKARLAQAAAQKVLAAHVEALFEEALRIDKLFSGSRLLRGVNRVGGVSLGASEAFVERLPEVSSRVEELRRRFESIYATSLSNRNYMDRLHGIALVRPELAAAFSLTGPSLRALGMAEDLRLGEELLPGFEPIVKDEGDSLARMEVRAEEVSRSCAIVAAQIEALLSEGASGHLDAASGGSAGAAREVAVPGAAIHGAADAEGVGAAESPTGTVAWKVGLRNGRVESVYVSTPSLFGFRVFADALRGHIFTDFPFAFDSFGLSFADAAR
jgi:Ni,Fe-hydrogenase III large subunit